MEQNNQIMRVAHNKSSASWHKLRKTLNQVQGDDNTHPVTPTAAEGSRNIYSLPHQTPRPCLELLHSGLQKSASRTLDPRNKHEDLSKFRRHSDLIRMPTASFGFTLVELAIALMVIGLLIGGVLKGQELIENAKITATIRQVKAYEAATLIFRNTYNALPGDIKKPDRIPNCTNDNDMICGIAGTGNGKIIPTDTTPRYIETYNFFPHLTKAGMIQGPEGGTLAQMQGIVSAGYNAQNDAYFTPELPIPSNYEMQIIHRERDVSGQRILEKGHYLYFTEISAKYLDALDSKMDDGKANSGQVTFEDTVCTIDGDYTVWNHEESCDAYIGLGF